MAPVRYGFLECRNFLSLSNLHAKYLIWLQLSELSVVANRFYERRYMSETKNRQQRKAAKEVPSRRISRVYASRHNVLYKAEGLQSRLSKSNLNTQLRAELDGAIKSVVLIAREVSPTTPSARQILDEASRELTHLNLAQSWLTSATRVLASLDGAAHDTRHEIIRAMDRIKDSLHSRDLGGALTAQIRTLENLVLTLR